MPIVLPCGIYANSLLSQHVLSLYHVGCVSVFPSLSYTNMHIPYCLPTKYGNLHSLAQPSFVYVSLSISELHEQAYFHCSFLWCEKGVYQQFIRIVVSYH